MYELVLFRENIVLKPFLLQRKWIRILCIVINITEYL